MGWIAFWIVLGVCGLAVTITSYLSRRETEATIRKAIESGAVADAEAIARLKAPSGLSWAQRLTVLGVIALFAGAGVAVFALVLGANEPESVSPLLAIAAFTAFLAAGLLAAGAWLRRASSARH
ncbi:MAG TPA: hypothetical protein VEA80_14580 [Vitreimonas sp.]|uniref:hypothetical protein n=1 Tax=Vitreimonas sp. TaxID=3069702 RepID=UPI002D66293C|nr:hypothetical protein [Vitreimonas sp.]HYD88697.1 hypothetical protein [Vitreimonas sp.]